MFGPRRCTCPRPGYVLNGTCSKCGLAVSHAQGFTLVELMIVLVVLGILAAVAVPNFMALRDRAREGAVKANMHTFQLAAEDFAAGSDGAYAETAQQVAGGAAAAGGGAGAGITWPPRPSAPGAGLFPNPFTGSSGDGLSWEDRASCASPPSASQGIVSYADSAATGYNIKGEGKAAPLGLVLTGGAFEAQASDGGDDSTGITVTPVGGPDGIKNP